MNEDQLEEIEPALKTFADDIQEALGYLRAARVVQAEQERRRLVRAAVSKVRHLQEVLPALPLPEMAGVG